MENRITVQKGDITKLNIDAIVNAANSSLLGGGGVDGAIHLAAGGELTLACGRLKGCDVADAKITPGFNLPAKHVIHTVGPTYWGNNLNVDQDGNTKASHLLRKTYHRCLTLASEHQFGTVAFPSISTGAFRYPMAEATEIAIETILDYLKSNKFPERVILVAFSDKDLAIIKDIRQKFLEALHR